MMCPNCGSRNLEVDDAARTLECLSCGYPNNDEDYTESDDD